MKFAPALLIVCALVGCQAASPMVRTDSVNLEPLVEYHDEHVQADPDMAEAARQAALDESAELLALVAAVEMLPQESLALALAPVVDRYDAYVLAAWPALSPLERRYLPRTSDLAREVAGLPLSAWPSE